MRVWSKCGCEGVNLHASSGTNRADIGTYERRRPGVVAVSRVRSEVIEDQFGFEGDVS